MSGFKLYRFSGGVALESAEGLRVLPGVDWDALVNDDQLYASLSAWAQKGEPVSALDGDLLPPLQSQEVWAAGVTYFRSKVGRQEESQAAGGSDFYARVYEADRPELFFKAQPYRVSPHGGQVRIRKDSVWDVPEPELTLMINRSGKVVAYTIGNDMSSRSIEGENPLYLPQAKCYDGSTAIGPCLYVPEGPLPADTPIELDIRRDGQSVFSGQTQVSQIKRRFDELASWLFRECSFPHGALLMTGTGIVPDSSFTLQSGDEVHIRISPIGVLTNIVA